MTIPILTKAEAAREAMEYLPAPRSISAEERLMRLTDEARRIHPRVMELRAYAREMGDLGVPKTVVNLLEATLIDIDRFCRKTNEFTVEGY